MATTGISEHQHGDIETAVAALRQRFGERLQTGEAIRRQHGHTLTWVPNQPPDAVVWPESTEEVQEIVKVAASHRVPLIPFGAGTSLEGHVNAPFGGISVDMSRMNRVLQVNERDLDCVVQAGVSRKQINDYLRDMGLFFPIDPGAEEATLGGMASTRASGTNAVRYGTMRESVLSLTAVMADGEVVTTGGRARRRPPAAAAARRPGSRPPPPPARCRVPPAACAPGRPSWRCGSGWPRPPRRSR